MNDIMFEKLTVDELETVRGGDVLPDPDLCSLDPKPISGCQP